MRPFPSGVLMDKVVLLHGIGRTSRSLDKLEGVLQDEGYQTLSITYPSRRLTLEQLAEWLREVVIDAAFWNETSGYIHFVGHSMGGLLIRYYLDRYCPEIPRHKLGRVVMMGTPHQGSPVADFWHKWHWYKWFYGPAGQQLTTSAMPHVVKKPYYELGMIAGTLSWPYVDSWFLMPNDSDGRVSVESTKIEGMKDHFIVPATHTFIMDRPDVQRQIVSFLKSGSFTQK